MKTPLLALATLLALVVSSTARAQAEPFAGADALLKQAVAASGTPDSEQQILKDAIPSPTEDTKFRAVGAAWAVARNLAANGVTDPAVHERLLRQALYGDENARKGAVAESKITRGSGAPVQVASSSVAVAVPTAPAVSAPAPVYAAPAYAAPAPAPAAGTDLGTIKTATWSPRSPTEALVGYGATSLRLKHDDMTLGPWTPEAPATWAVYQGPRRLDAVDFLDITAHDSTGLQGKIQEARRSATLGWSIAGIGLGGLAGGLIGMGVSDKMESYLTWEVVSAAGAGVGITGLFAASFPSGRVARLTHEPSETLTFEEAQNYARSYNEALRSRLGLSPVDAAEVELSADR